MCVLQAGMFNDKSTHNERQEALQTVMRRGGMDGGAQVHTPPQLNKLLARSTEEFKIFQQVAVLLAPSTPIALPAPLTVVACSHQQLVACVRRCPASGPQKRHKSAVQPCPLIFLRQSLLPLLLLAYLTDQIVH